MHFHPSNKKEASTVSGEPKRESCRWVLDPTYVPIWQVCSSSFTIVNHCVSFSNPCDIPRMADELYESTYCGQQQKAQI